MDLKVDLKVDFENGFECEIWKWILEVDLKVEFGNWFGSRFCKWILLVCNIDEIDSTQLYFQNQLSNPFSKSTFKPTLQIHVQNHFKIWRHNPVPEASSNFATNHDPPRNFDTCSAHIDRKSVVCTTCKIM